MNLSEPLPPSDPVPAVAGEALRPGDMLEDFEILQVIGRTRCGVLYLARSQTYGTTAAIKEYMPAAIALRGPDGQVEPTRPLHAEVFDRGLQAFLTEALTLSQFAHPHLLHVSAIWEANGTAYRSMPYLAGTTLLAWRASMRAPASQAQLQTLLDGLLAALETLHRSGLAHGQVDPTNIYLLEDGRPVLMDFGAAHEALLSDLRNRHLDAYADPTQVPGLIVADLHAVAAVLHFAVGNVWVLAHPGDGRRHAPLADVLLGFKDQASALEYQPEFLTAIDTALALPLAKRPASIMEFRALFDAKTGIPSSGSGEARAHASSGQTAEPGLGTPPMPRRESLKGAARPLPRNSTESVLAMLANFDRGPRAAADDVEPFQNPPVPTLTEEAEPALPPMRTSLFDAMEATEALAHDAPGHLPGSYTAMPIIRRHTWRRRALAAGVAAVVIGSLGLCGWQFLG